MARLETWYKQDLKKPLIVHKHSDVFNQDNRGNLIGVEVYSNGEPVTLAGSVSGYCLLADGTTVPAVGASRSGNKASVLIPQTAYGVPGPITITIKNVEGNDIATLCAVVGLVRQSVSGNLVNPGSVVTDWSNSINAQLQAVQTAADNVGAIVAAPFDENVVYVVGNYVTNNGNLYRITADHAAGVTWADTAKVQCTVGSELFDLKSALTSTNNYLGAKNLAYTKDKTSTIQGLTIVWVNGIATINGTTTATAYYNFTTIKLYAGRNYKINGCPENASLYVLDSSDSVVAQANYGQDVSFTVPSDGTYKLRLRVPNGRIFTDAVFTPMVRYAGTSADFVPYIPTNEELLANDFAIKEELQGADTALSDRIDDAVDNIDEVDVKTNTIKTAFDQYANNAGNKNRVEVSDGNYTVNGVEFVKTNGVVTANGTSTGNIYWNIANVFLYQNSDYVMSGSNGAAILQVTNYAADTIIASQNNGQEVPFTVPSDGLYRLRIRISTGKTFENEPIYPMIRDSFYLDSTFEAKKQENKGIAVWFGDSFVQANSLASAGLDQTKRFSTLVSKNFRLIEKNYAVGGMGYITGATPYITQVQNANADRTYDHNLVTHVFVSGGINDLNTENIETLLYPAVKNVVDTIKTVFPNAQIYVIPLTYYDKNISQIGFWAYKTIASICAEGNAHLIGNAYTWLNGMLDDILTDGVHPNIAGHALIASYIMNALTTGNSFAYPASCAFSTVSSKLDTDTAYYFCTLKHNGKITVNGNFKLNSAATTNERLYQYENTTTKNNLTYIGRYGKHVPCFNLSTGDSGVLLVSQEETANGYINYANAVSPLPAGVWKVMSTDLNIGVQEYCGNKN